MQYQAKQISKRKFVLLLLLCLCFCSCTSLDTYDVPLSSSGYNIFSSSSEVELELFSIDWEDYFGLKNHFVAPQLYQMNPSSAQIDQLENFLGNHSEEIQRIINSTYQLSAISLIDVTGDDIPEIIIWQMGNKDQNPSDYTFETVSGYGFTFSLESGKYLGIINGSVPEAMGWYEDVSQRKTFYSIEANFSRQFQQSGDIYNYAYILWEVKFNNNQIECIPNWLYLVQHVYDNEGQYTERDFSILQPNIEAINTYRDSSTRSLEILMPQFVEGMAEPIKEFWNEIIALPTQRYEYGTITSSGYLEYADKNL